MAIEGGNFTTAFFKEDSVRDLFNVEEQQKKQDTEIVSKSKEEEKEEKNSQSVKDDDNDDMKPQTENNLTNEQYEKVLFKFKVINSIKPYFVQFFTENCGSFITITCLYRNSFKFLFILIISHSILY